MKNNRHGKLQNDVKAKARYLKIRQVSGKHTSIMHFVLGLALSYANQ